VREESLSIQNETPVNGKRTNRTARNEPVEVGKKMFGHDEELDEIFTHDDDDDNNNEHVRRPTTRNDFFSFFTSSIHYCRSPASSMIGGGTAAAAVIVDTIGKRGCAPKKKNELLVCHRKKCPVSAPLLLS
jgi:hypothetical protein